MVLESLFSYPHGRYEFRECVLIPQQEGEIILNVLYNPNSEQTPHMLAKN